MRGPAPGRRESTNTANTNKGTELALRTARAAMLRTASSSAAREVLNTVMRSLQKKNRLSHL